ncbi:MAG: THUMP domain-containing protein [Candidatus Heimdallarchaeota archaeon]|nr:MAG: THUMP domain-containing protein [Candidatus Heimdallarchaeota archaeon]
MISSQRSFERDALSEAYYVISDVLGYKTRPLKSRVPGLAILRLIDETDPFRVIKEIKQYTQEKGPLVACLKIVPLERLIKTNLPKIVENAVSLAKLRITPTNTWKIHVRKRQTTLRTLQVIEKIAEEINWGVVNLTSPDFEIRIEIIRDLTGVSVMEPNLEFSLAYLMKEESRGY